MDRYERQVPANLLSLKFPVMLVAFWTTMQVSIGYPPPPPHTTPSPQSMLTCIPTFSVFADLVQNSVVAQL